jgi:cytochrome c biogenesis protein CcmG/thiol:disulfide interchange protein DsbE
MATVVIVGAVYLGRPASQGDSPGIATGRAAPAFAGTTLDGAALDLAQFKGRPVVVNFWGPSCVPCRDEFPLFIDELSKHAADGLAIVGVLADDPPGPARDFVAAYHATWPTIIDPDGAIKAAYRVLGRPQTYFIDATGVLRSIQVGQLTSLEFECHFARMTRATPPPSCGP